LILCFAVRKTDMKLPKSIVGEVWVYLLIFVPYFLIPMVHLSSSFMVAVLTGTVSIPLLMGATSQSAVGVDYRDLTRLLQSQRWEAAAAETDRLVFEVAGKSQQGTIGSDLLTPQAIAQFPCQDLKTIDHLWRQESHDRFGFRVQLLAAQRQGVSVNYTQLQKSPEQWQKFHQSLGWEAWRDRWSNAEVEPEPLKSKTDVPEGTFPLPVRSTGDFGDRPAVSHQRAFFGAGFLERAKQCQVDVL
jgi:GUN4-like